MKAPAAGMTEVEFVELLDRVLGRLSKRDFDSIPPDELERFIRRVWGHIRHGWPLIRRSCARVVREEARDRGLVEAAEMLPADWSAGQRARYIAAVMKGKIPWGETPARFHQKFDVILGPERIRQILSASGRFPTTPAKGAKILLWRFGDCV